METSYESVGRNHSIVDAPVNPELAATLRSLQPGQRIRITQTVRVGFKQWTTTVTGTFPR